MYRARRSGLGAGLHRLRLWRSSCPLIAATVGLAVPVVGAALRAARGPGRDAPPRAWAFVLLEPAHPVRRGSLGADRRASSALLAVAALVLAGRRGRRASSAALLGAGRVHQADAAARACSGWCWCGPAGRAPREALRDAAVFRPSWAAVFVVDAGRGARLAYGAGLQHRPNAHFLMTGGMSYTTVARLFRDPLALPGHWWLIGMLWVVALAAGLALLHRGPGFEDLARGARGAGARLPPHARLAGRATTWRRCSPRLVVVLASLGEPRPAAARPLSWLIPLAFAVANAGAAAARSAGSRRSPAAWRASAATRRGGLRLGEALLPLRAALVVAWQVAGWWTAAVCLRLGRLSAPVPPSARWPRERRRARLRDGLELRIADEPSSAELHRPVSSYPTSTSAAGPRPASPKASTSREEGVGFGVPVLKRGVQTVFPGRRMELTVAADGPDWAGDRRLSSGSRRATGRRAAEAPVRPRVLVRGPGNAGRRASAACRRCGRPLTATSNAVRRRSRAGGRPSSQTAASRDRAGGRPPWRGGEDVVPPVAA